MTAITPQHISERLDAVERSLPPVPSRAMALGRAGARRSFDVARATTERVGGTAAAIARTATTAAKTAAGQTRSAVVRSIEFAQDRSNEAVGQLRAQAARTGRTAEREVAGLLDDAAEAVAPDRPLDELTKEELYELAQARDIEGRSQMTKSELVKALG